MTPDWVTQTWVGVLWDRVCAYRVDRRHRRGDHTLCRGCVDFSFGRCLSDVDTSL